MKESLIACASTGRFVYALGAFGHVLFQLDTNDLSVRQTTVGAVGGHISRHFLVDLYGHIYVPRVSVGNKDLATSPNETKEELVSELLVYGTHSMDGNGHGYLVGWRPIPTPYKPYVFEITWDRGLE